MSSINPSAPSTSRAIAPSAFPKCQPWVEFFALRSFTRPYSLGETSLRLKRNLAHFRVNYAMIALFVVFLSLLWHPISLIVFLAVFAAWFFLYFSRDDPVVVFRRAIDDRLVLAALAALTVVALVLTGVWLNVVVSVLFVAAVVVLHAAFRSTDDLYVDELEVSDGGLVSVVSGSPTYRTGFGEYEDFGVIRRIRVSPEQLKASKVAEENVGRLNERNGMGFGIHSLVVG